MQAINLKRWNSEFNRNVVKIMSGTLVAQIIAISISPILSRIYTPEDFSNLAIYVSIVSILTVFATGKYENAIILPKEDRDAYTLISLATILTFIIGSIFLMVFLFFNDIIIGFLKLKAVESWLLFVPITIFAHSIYRILGIWFNRKKAYYKLSGNRVLTSGLNGFLKIGLQLGCSLNAFGLVLSQASSQIISTSLFGWDFLKKNHQNLTLNYWELKRVAISYKNFPLYSMPAAFFSIFSRELPVLLLAIYFESSVVGLYILTKMVLDTPSSLLSGSVLEVFKQKATEDYHQLGNCKKIFHSTLKKLLLVSFLPFLAIYLIAPILFPFIFGDQWSASGKFAQILAFMYFMKFNTTPLVFVFYIVGQINIELIIQIILFLVTLMSLSVGGLYIGDINKTLLIYGIGYSLVYLLYLALAYRAALGNIQENNSKQ